MSNKEIEKMELCYSPAWNQDFSKRR